MLNKEESHTVLLRRILDGITHEPFTIEAEWVGPRRLNLHVHVTDNDIGLVVGKRAILIKSLQNVFQAIAKHSKMDTLYVCAYSPTQRKGHNTGARKDAKPDWDQLSLLDLVVDILSEIGHPPIHLSVQYVGEAQAINIQPPLPEQLGASLHAIIEAYGKSFGKSIGLAL